ncbi:dihydrodipicolinate synthase family protein [Poriferisphaera sp. WC338]|uniref:dihydrodipicolinate synthase family protein n=1 Tax=Poriferisphaera sp. WC338 TaxID=3425129 RepID=UPI003D815495
MSVFRGLYPPLITPFHADGKINEKGLRDHIDYMIDGGVDGFCAGSSTGEFMNLTREEWETVLHITKDQVAGRVPMLAGGAGMSTAETIERSQYAEKMGYDGLLVISPWYQVHTQREVYAHFKALREAVHVPIMIYNNPPVTGIQLGVELLERLANDGIIQYMKDADSDPYTIARLKMRVGDKIEFFYGHDNNAMGAFAYGATGWVSGTANFDPHRWSKFVHTCIDDNDYTLAKDLWYEILPFVEIATVGQNGERADWIAIIKRGLEMRGKDVGTVRPPMLPVTKDVEEKLQGIVSNLFAEEVAAALA